MSEQTKFSPLLSLARNAQRRRMDMQCDPQWVLDLFAERDALQQLRKELEEQANTINAERLRVGKENAALHAEVERYKSQVVEEAGKVIHFAGEAAQLRAEVERLRPPSGHAPYPEQIKAWQEASRQDLARCARMSACIDQLTSTLEDIRSQLDAGLMPSIGAIDKALEASG